LVAIMDLAITLVKSVMRAFYQTREILVIDALILHEAYVYAHMV
jgi:transcription initiation factor TFIIE subunit alpha